MEELKNQGFFKVDDLTLTNIQKTFKAYCCTEEETISTISETYNNKNYLCDPHTAVGMKAAKDYKKAYPDNVPVVVLSTASPYKFPAAVSKALGLPLEGDEYQQIDAIHQKTGVPVPKNLSSIKNKRVLHNQVIDRDKIIDYVLESLNI
jgi:threonine synthase